MVTVYAWYPWEFYHYMFAQVERDSGKRVGENTAGHATLMYPHGYISLWRGSRIVESYSDDIIEYGILPHLQVSINGLDELGIHYWWQGLRAQIKAGDLQYSFCGLNCARTVAQALDVGCAGQVSSYYSWNMMWSPKDAIQYAEAVGGWMVGQRL